jgi:hypothetical protein
MVPHNRDSVKGHQVPEIRKIRPPALDDDLCTFSAWYGGRDLLDLRLNLCDGKFAVKAWPKHTTIPIALLQDEDLLHAALTAFLQAPHLLGYFHMKGTQDVYAQNN